MVESVLEHSSGEYLSFGSLHHDFIVNVCAWFLSRRGVARELPHGSCIDYRQNRGQRGA